MLRISKAAQFSATPLSSAALAIPPSLTTSTAKTLTRLTTSTTALAAVIDDVRIFLRLGSLLSIYSWGASVYRSPPNDWMLQCIAWAQVCAYALFQYLENGAYLGSKGVIEFGPRKVRKWYVWSSRFWMAHVILEFGRLGREWALERVKVTPKLEPPEKLNEGVEERQSTNRKLTERQGWWKEAYVNAAWLPVTVHYGIESGFAGEAQIAVLSLIAGLPGLRDAWRATS